MKRLFLFNPENDIALARNISRFTPPLQAQLLHDAGAALPFWLGDEDDYMLVSGKEQDAINRWRDAMKTGGPRPVASARDVQIASLEPWGWSRDTCRQFLNAGVNDDIVRPYLVKTDIFRDYSHRRNSLILLSLLHENGYDTPAPQPVEATCLDDVADFVAREGAAFLKSPWSSSGRGVFPVTRETLPASADRIGGIIRRQDSVMVEPSLDKIIDFAMLFYDGGRRFHGYSLFFNSTATGYGGNYVASDKQILSVLGQYISGSYITSLSDTLTHLLPSLFPLYDGPVGIDMLIYHDLDGRTRIDPCVEINLRTTMGFVARGVYERLGRDGVMSVLPGRHGTPLQTSDLFLAPAGRSFNFIFRKS